MGRLCALCLVMLGVAGCATVRPWQRADLSRRSMTAGFNEQAIAGQYRAKTLESTTGGGPPNGTPGGGCGCTH